MLYGTEGIHPVQRTERLAELYPKLEERWHQRARAKMSVTQTFFA